MCLAAFAIGLNARFPFFLLANRDERFDRPAAAMHWWPQPDGAPAMLAGRDLSAGGTWLGLNQQGQLALVTNVREPGRNLPGSPSRGELVPACLRGELAEPGAPGGPAAAELQALQRVARNGFNLVMVDLALAGRVGSQPAAHWLSNRPSLQGQQRSLGDGVWGVSNAALDTPWPKLRQLKQRLQQMLAALPASSPTGSPADALPNSPYDERAALAGLEAAGLAALADRTAAADAELPATGVPLQRERQLSSAFIRIVGDDPAAAEYGTRCATLVAVEQRGPRRHVHVLERSFGADGAASGDVRYSWELPERGISGAALGDAASA